MITQLSHPKGAPRILETTLPEHFSQHPDNDDEMDWEPFKDYARININVRQVLGFDPPTHTRCQVRLM
jgi:alkylated DNA repair protein alkB family protein 1